MAKKKKKQENDDLILDVESAYSSTEQYVNNNRKSLTIIIAAIVVVVGGYFGYQELMVKPNADKGARAIWKAEYYFSIDSFQLAINGGPSHMGFAEIANKYSGSKQGDLATYYMGLSYLHMGDYMSAIDNFDKVSFDDEIIGSMAIGNMGDAYMELGDAAKGIEYYEQAAANSDNQFTAPIYLNKAALAYESLGQYDKAVANYKKIREDYPESTEAREVEKYLARAESFIGQ